MHYFYPHNGICIQKYKFWPKNDGEKWSRKNIFEIPLLLLKSAQNHKVSNKNNYLPVWKDFKLIFLDHHFKAKNDIFGYRFHFKGKTDV